MNGNFKNGFEKTSASRLGKYVASKMSKTLSPKRLSKGGTNAFDIRNGRGKTPQKVKKYLAGLDEVRDPLRSKFKGESGRMYTNRRAKMDTGPKMSKSQKYIKAKTSPEQFDVLNSTRNKKLTARYREKWLKRVRG